MSPNNLRRMGVTACVLATCGLASLVARSDDQPKADHPPAGGSKIAKVFEQALPEGDFQKVSAITVAYGPGGTSPKHRHDVAVFAYVLEGEIESQLEGEELKTFRPGETWYEAPGTIHVVSRNASKEKPAKLLVIFVQEEGKAPTTLVK